MEFRSNSLMANFINGHPLGLDFFLSLAGSQDKSSVFSFVFIIIWVGKDKQIINDWLGVRYIGFSIGEDFVYRVGFSI